MILVNETPYSAVLPSTVLDQERMAAALVARVTMRHEGPLVFDVPAAPFDLLPDKAPKIGVDGRNGKLAITKPVIHTVEIEPDLGRVSIVWRGAAPALRPYMPEELAKMPLVVEWRDE